MKKLSVFGPGIVAGLLAAGMHGASLALPAQRTIVPVPSYLAEMPRRKRKRIEQKRSRAKSNLAGRLRNRKGQHNRYLDPGIERMTNWQRSQWARAGYSPNRVREFAALSRRDNHKHNGGCNG